MNNHPCHYIYNVHCSFIYVFLPFIYHLILLFLFLLLKKTENSRNVHLINYNFKSELNYNYVYRKILITSLIARFGRNFQIFACELTSVTY